MKKNFLEVGKVISVHGIKGFIKLIPWCDDVCLFKSLSFLYFDSSGKIKKIIEKVAFKKKIILMKFYDIDNIESAKKMINKILYIDRKEIKLKNGENFIEDLIGVKVIDYNKENICYGEIKDVIKTRANDIYIVKDKNNIERFVPVVDDVVIQKDLDKNIIYINVLEGLFDV